MTTLNPDSFQKEGIKIPTLLNDFINNNNSSVLNFGQNKSTNKSFLFLKSNYKLIKTYSSKGFMSKKRNFQNELLELQNFKADSEQIWVAVLNSFHTFLATGGKSGVLKIWKMNTIRDDDNKYNKSLLFSENKERKLCDTKCFLNIIEETVYKIYCEHSLDIIDISWSNKYPNLLVSVSLDQKAILYDITQNSSLKTFYHKSAITSISFYPDKILILNIFLKEKTRFSFFSDEIKNNAPPLQKKDDYFITSCFNSQVYIWNIYNDKEPLYSIYTNEITLKVDLIWTFFCNL